MDLDLSDVKANDPVPLTTRDRQFFTQLELYMKEESAKVGDHPSRERFVIFRLVFERVNILLHLFQPLSVFPSLSRSLIKHFSIDHYFVVLNTNMNDVSMHWKWVPMK